MANAFQPATEVSDPNRFAGREDQIRKLTDSLHIVGSVPLIYGQRGLGKSSLALQIASVAKGDSELLDQIELSNLALKGAYRFISFHVTCTDSTRTFEDIIRLLLGAIENLEYVHVSTSGTRNVRIVDRSSSRTLAKRSYEEETPDLYAAEVGRLAYQNLTDEQKLIQNCEILTRYFGQPVLFVIDELDRVKRTKGLASFLKANSSERLKFVLVGIASNQSELLADHASITRQLAPVLVPIMDKAELEDIVTRTEDYLQARNEFFTFSPSAKALLADTAAGFPWFVHVIGQSALLAVADNGRSEVRAQDVRAAIKDLVGNTFAQQYADRYQAAVKDSSHRETVLRLCAGWNNVDIPTGEIYPMAKKLRVTNPSTYATHLLSDAYGDVLMRPAIQSRALVRFRDEMFKVYVNLRGSIYLDIDENVDSAYKLRDGA